jgi:hypothetical protein
MATRQYKRDLKKLELRRRKGMRMLARGVAQAEVARSYKPMTRLRPSAVASCDSYSFQKFLDERFSDTRLDTSQFGRPPAKRAVGEKGW